MFGLLEGFIKTKQRKEQARSALGICLSVVARARPNNNKPLKVVCCCLVPRATTDKQSTFNCVGQAVACSSAWARRSGRSPSTEGFEEGCEEGRETRPEQGKSYLRSLVVIRNKVVCWTDVQKARNITRNALGLCLSVVAHARARPNDNKPLKVVCCSLVARARDHSQLVCGRARATKQQQNH